MYALGIKISNNINIELYEGFECSIITNNRAFYATSDYKKTNVNLYWTITGLKGYVLHNGNSNNNTFFIFKFTQIYNSIKIDSYEQIERFTYENIEVLLPVKIYQYIVVLNTLVSIKSRN